jgi:hypothetical protein
MYLITVLQDVNMIPIAFNLMLIRVYRNREHEAEDMYANAKPRPCTGRVRSSLRFAPAVVSLQSDIRNTMLQSSVDDSSESIATPGMDGDLEKQFVDDHSYSDGEREAGMPTGGTSTGTCTVSVPSSSQSDDASGSTATPGMAGDLEKQFVVDLSHSDGELEAGATAWK